MVSLKQTSAGGAKKMKKARGQGGDNRKWKTRAGAEKALSKEFHKEIKEIGQLPAEYGGWFFLQIKSS